MNTKDQNIDIITSFIGGLVVFVTIILIAVAIIATYPFQCALIVGVPIAAVLFCWAMA